jgi:hypothetical protein
MFVAMNPSDGRRRWGKALVMALMLLAPVGCLREPSLLPQWGYLRVPSQPVDAVATHDGVRVFLQTDRWRGPGHPCATTIKVTIHNLGRRPIVVSHGDLGLIGPDGRRALALLPEQAAQGGAPAAELAARGLPEGRLDPGHHFSGFVYFAPLPHVSGPVLFTARIIDGPAGAYRGTLSVSLLQHV